VFGTVPLNTFKFGSQDHHVPIELLQDSADRHRGAGEQAHARAHRPHQNQKFTSASGTTEPFGITCRGERRQDRHHRPDAHVIYDDLVDLIDSLDIAYLAPKASRCSS
jgi:hypothetical protein